MTILAGWSYRDELTVHNEVIFRGNRVIISKVLELQHVYTKLEMLCIGQQ